MTKKITLVLAFLLTSSFASANVVFCKKNTMVCAKVVAVTVTAAAMAVALKENQGPAIVSNNEAAIDQGAKGPTVETLPTGE